MQVQGCYDELGAGNVSRIGELDMSLLFSGRPTSTASFLRSLEHQCRSVGLFYIKNHGVPQDLCDSVLRSSRRFFDLPDDIKLQIDYRQSPQFRGYMKLGCENTNGLVDFREQIDFGPEEHEDVDISAGKIKRLVYPLYRRLRGPNQWVDNDTLPGFRATVEEYMMRMSQLSRSLLQAITLSLGLDQGYFKSLLGSTPHVQMKLLRYPMKPNTDDGEREEYGVGPHTDSGILTLLLQDATGGLQAKTLDGEWNDVPFKYGTFVVNLGEMIQLATGGYYVATIHRVLSLPSRNPRYSVPFFFNPSLDSQIKPMNIRVGHEKAPSWQKLLEDGVIGGNSTHGGKNVIMPVYGENAFKSFSRSHVEVVKRHHPDLLEGQEMSP